MHRNRKRQSSGTTSSQPEGILKVCLGSSLCASGHRSWPGSFAAGLPAESFQQLNSEIDEQALLVVGTCSELAPGSRQQHERFVQFPMDAKVQQRLRVV